MTDAEGGCDVLNIRDFRCFFDASRTVADLHDAGLIPPGDAGVLEEEFQNTVRPRLLHQLKIPVFQSADKLAGLLGRRHVVTFVTLRNGSYQNSLFVRDMEFVHIQIFPDFFQTLPALQNGGVGRHNPGKRPRLGKRGGVG